MPDYHKIRNFVSLILAAMILANNAVLPIMCAFSAIGELSGIIEYDSSDSDTDDSVIEVVGDDDDSAIEVVGDDDDSGIEVVGNEIDDSEGEVVAIDDIDENEQYEEEDESLATEPELELYDNGTILIYSYEQLLMVGSGEPLHRQDAVNVGSGDILEDSEGEPICYSSDGVYRLAVDIAVPDGTHWLLPDDFSGRIAAAVSDPDRDLYNSESDTIYLYNRKQLEAVTVEDAGLYPVMTGDADVEQFGSGQVIYPDGSENYLTYSEDHHYVISEQFCTDMPKPKAAPKLRNAKSRGASSLAGRDFEGQVIKEIDGTKYILIGNEAQLRKIGSGDHVYTRVYQTESALIDSPISLDNNGNQIMLYGGDADLKMSQNGYVESVLGTVPQEATWKARRGVDQTTGEVFRTWSANSWDTGETYSSTANYIVFRDIDLSTDNGQDEDWVPIMFSGTMYGSKSTGSEKLWDGSGIGDATELTALDEENRPVISNVHVNQNDAIDLGKYNGIGFFATITNQTNTANIGISGGTAVVENIELSTVSVANNTSSHTFDATLLNTVTTALGGVLGFLVDGLVGVLSFGSVSLDLQTTLSNLLNARGQDPSIYATGAFAGRIFGDVVVKDCVVSDSVSVSNVNSHTGGFVGYAEGMTEYSGLSQVLGGTVDVLSGLLNIIPGVGLGDLITILLDNALPVENLIPTRYINPIIEDCTVSDLTGTVGLTTTDYAGGFAGQQTGTQVENCTVTDSTYTVQAQNFGGGFVGLMRDAEVKGTLDGVGIDLTSLLDDLHPQSVEVNCAVRNSECTVTGENCLGGFTGAMTSSYAVDCDIETDEDLSVSGTGDCVGGFVGHCTVGWQSSLGANENHENSLLGTVRQLATGLLSTNASQGQQLLSIMGVAPSAVLGCQMEADSISVHADGSYAGGIIGKGDGIYLGITSQDALDTLAEWNSGTILDSPSDRSVTVEGLSSVTADEHYAGGVAGFIGSAAFQGLLNDVVGLGDFIGFTVDTVSVTGASDGYDVAAAGNNAGGAFGAAVGGTATNVTLTDIAHVEADNRAGGFVGVAGPGELIGAGGLTVNLLGLDRVLQVSNLLAVGQGVEVHVEDSTVTGIESGFTVEATGEREPNSEMQYVAGGFIGKANSTKISGSHVYNLLSVSATEEGGYAGGYIGTSETGGLADVANQDSASVKSLIEADGLVKAIGYLIPSYTDCTVHYVNGGYVEADVAGGYAADLESGTVDNETHKEDGDSSPYAVYNIDHVTGQTYGGGFGGRIVSGSLAEAGKGISILGQTGLDLDLTNLIGVMDVYVPIVKYSGIKSDRGFTVEATDVRTGAGELLTGSAGGYAGYMSGAQISYCDVNKLKRSEVVPPDDLESIIAASYFDGSSSYAVTGGRYSGGYVGNMDIGSAASVGEGLSALGNLLNLSNVASALSVVVSTIEHSDVAGMPGGYAILATGDGDESTEGKVGRAGGFVGNIEGGHIQDSHALNFSYVVGEVAAGGYVGEMKPGSVAKLLGNTSAADEGSILNKLLGVSDISSNLLTLVQSFVPTIRNSTTTCIPCGGAVRAQASSDSAVQRGMAGGYVGHNDGGQIWGNNTNTWESENDGVGRVFGWITDNSSIGSYTGDTSPCEAVRIRSIYGYEYAGGFTGYMTCASTAETGNIGLLGGLISANSALSALNAVYPTEENTAIYGPLMGLDVRTWNTWIDYVGKYGGLGQELLEVGKVDNAEELESKIAEYAYGYHVVAGRPNHEQNLISEGGDAGGYVGLMVGGVVTNGQAHNAKKVKAMRSAGGFAGRMKTGGAAEFGNVNLLGLNLNLDNLLDAAEVFVPAVKSSSVRGYQAGLTVIGSGLGSGYDVTYRSGYAGGYAGSVYGAQIWGDEPDDGSASGCRVTKLRRVQGRNAAGGFVGLATSASVASVDTNASDGLLQGVLNSLVSNPSKLANVLQGTVTTMRGCSVSALDSDWGFVVEGVGENSYPAYAGGFAGSLEATVLGDDDDDSELKSISVSGLRSVNAELYAGGFFGLADVSSVASVSPDGTTTILSLVQAGNVSLLDVFRTYIYYGDAIGVPEGFTVKAHSSSMSGYLSEVRHAGCAGGFGGGLMNGHVENCNAVSVNTVDGLNYVGGFIGHMGKNGVADVDSAQVGQPLANLLSATAGVGDVFGAHAELCSLTGVDDGLVVLAHDGAEEIAGGFVGYADLSRVKESTVTNLKLVSSEEIAGGFVGKTNMNHLVDVEADSVLVQLVAGIVVALLQLLQVDTLENLFDSSLLTLPLPGGLTLAELGLLKNGDLISLNLLGIQISASLADNGNAALVTIGDSKIEIADPSNPNIDQAALSVELFKANATKVENCSVTGIGVGYDVYGGSATNQQDGSGALGRAGGFVGFNNEGRMIQNEMILCDVVRGAPDYTGPFSGYSLIDSVYPRYSDLTSIEGQNDGEYNVYHVYRVADPSLVYLVNEDHEQINETAANQTTAEQETVQTAGASVTYNRYKVNHLDENQAIQTYADWRNAVMASESNGSGTTADVDVYVSNAKAVLMDDNPTAANQDRIVPEPAEAQDPCDEKIALTVQKVWQDRNNIDGIRPNSVKIRLLRSGSAITYDASGEQVGDALATESDTPIVNTTLPDGTQVGEDGWIDFNRPANAGNIDAAWTKVIHDLPAASRTANQDGTETITYYTYKVEEMPVEKYDTDISYDSTGYTATITNTHIPILPLAGGMGDWMYMVCGVVVIAIGASMRKRRTHLRSGVRAK